MGSWEVCKGGQRTAAGQVLRTSKEVARQRGLERLTRGLVVQAASAHGVEYVEVAGLLDAVADGLELCARQSRHEHQILETV